MQQISVGELLNSDSEVTIKVVGNRVIIDVTTSDDVAILYEGSFKVVPLGSKRIKELRARRIWDVVVEKLQFLRLHDQ